MDLPRIEDVVNCLTKRGVYANVGNPGRVMPHLVKPLVAVVVKEAMHRKCTFLAYVCGPQSQGQSACTHVADQVAVYWTDMGATCHWGDYSFDGKCAMHIVKVYGTWDITNEQSE